MKWLLLALLLVGSASAASGEWAGVQYQEPHLTEQDTAAFDAGFRSGFLDGARDREERLGYDKRSQWVLERSVSTATFSTRALAVRLTYEDSARDVGYALGYEQGYKARQHPRYRELTPHTRRTDPWYDGSRLLIDYPEFESCEGRVKTRVATRAATIAPTVTVRYGHAHWQPPHPWYKHPYRVPSSPRGSPTVTSSHYWGPTRSTGWW